QGPVRLPPQKVELPEPVLRLRKAVCEEEIVRIARFNVRNSAGIAVNCGRAANRRFHERWSECCLLQEILIEKRSSFARGPSFVCSHISTKEAKRNAALIVA